MLFHKKMKNKYMVVYKNFSPRYEVWTCFSIQILAGLWGGYYINIAFSNTVESQSPGINCCKWAMAA